MHKSQKLQEKTQSSEITSKRGFKTSKNKSSE